MKKTFLILFVLALGSLISAETLDNLLQKGCPSPDREWSGTEYGTLEGLLASKQVPLFSLDSEPGHTLLIRMVNTENLSFYQNTTIPIQNRLTDLLNMMQASQSILMQYARAANSGHKVERELAHQQVYLLAIASMAIDLTDEYIRTIPKDEYYANRMAGFKQMKGGLTTLLNGIIVSLSERPFYSNESVAQMSAGVRQYYSHFAPLLSGSTKTEFHVKIKTLAAKEKNPEVKKELESLVKIMASS